MGERLRQAREDLWLSLGYVAKCLGIDEIEMENIEDGTRKVTSLELAVLSRLYGIPAEQLEHGHTYDEKDIRMLAGLTDHDRKEVLNLISFKQRLAAAM